MQAPAREASQTVGASPAAGLVSVRRHLAGAPPESAEATMRAQYREPASQGAEQPFLGTPELGEGWRADRGEQRAGVEEEPQEGVPMVSQQDDPMLVSQEGEGDPMLLSQPGQQQQEEQELSEGADTAEPAMTQCPRSLHEGYVPPSPLASLAERWQSRA